MIMSLDEGELIETKQSALTAMPGKKPNELANLVPQPIDPVENKSQILSEDSSQS